jgi:hypothetical protein
MMSELVVARKSAPLVDRAPPHAFFLISAVFHYLGPSFAVLLFAQIAPLGVAWLRIASAALIFALWRRPWRLFFVLSPHDRAIILALGVVLAAMNSIFYEAIAGCRLGRSARSNSSARSPSPPTGCARAAISSRWLWPPQASMRSPASGSAASRSALSSLS